MSRLIAEDRQWTCLFRLVLALALAMSPLAQMGFAGMGVVAGASTEMPCAGADTSDSDSRGPDCPGDCCDDPGCNPSQCLHAASVGIAQLAQPLLEWTQARAAFAEPAPASNLTCDREQLRPPIA